MKSSPFHPLFYFECLVSNVWVFEPLLTVDPALISSFPRGMGYYDVSVLEAALNKQHCTLAWFDARRGTEGGIHSCIANGSYFSLDSL